MIDVRSPGIAVAGTVKGSPLTAGNTFLGFESPLSESSVVGDRGVSELHSGVPIPAVLICNRCRAPRPDAPRFSRLS